MEHMKNANVFCSYIWEEQTSKIIQMFNASSKKQTKIVVFSIGGHGIFFQGGGGGPTPSPPSLRPPMVFSVIWFSSMP